MLNNEEIASSSQALWFGLFPIDDDVVHSLTGAASLESVVEHPHITFGYKVGVPDNIDWHGVYWVDVVGYGNDGINEGYEVAFPPELEDVYFGADIPHITISTSSDGSPVNTAFLDFEPLSEPFSVPMKFGYYLRGKYCI